MKKKAIELPKGYVTQTQIELWERDKERYESIYFDRDTTKHFSNEGIEYGKVVAEALENEEQVDDLLTDSALALLPKYDVRDQPIYVEWKTKYGWLTLHGRPDTLNSKTFDFREYKTGRTKWTQNKANKHFQLKFYAVLIYLKYGKMLHETYLDWIETDTVTSEVDGFPVSTIQPTGNVRSFKVILSTNDILQTMERIIRVSREIETAYMIYLGNK